MEKLKIWKNADIRAMITGQAGEAVRILNAQLDAHGHNVETEEEASEFIAGWEVKGADLVKFDRGRFIPDEQAIEAKAQEGDIYAEGSAQLAALDDIKTLQGLMMKYKDIAGLKRKDMEALPASSWDEMTGYNINPDKWRELITKI